MCDEDHENRERKYCNFYNSLRGCRYTEDKCPYLHKKKNCPFFMTTTGCRNGLLCPMIHDAKCSATCKKFTKCANEKCNNFCGRHLCSTCHQISILNNVFLCKNENCLEVCTKEFCDACTKVSQNKV
jgi:hypothetical protein